MAEVLSYDQAAQASVRRRTLNFCDSAAVRLNAPPRRSLLLLGVGIMLRPVCSRPARGVARRSADYMGGWFDWGEFNTTAFDSSQSHDAAANQECLVMLARAALHCANLTAALFGFSYVPSWWCVLAFLA